LYIETKVQDLAGVVMSVHAVVVWRDEYFDGDVRVEEKDKKDLHADILVWSNIVIRCGVVRSFK